MIKCLGMLQTSWLKPIKLHQHLVTSGLQNRVHQISPNGRMDFDALGMVMKPLTNYNGYNSVVLCMSDKIHVVPSYSFVSIGLSLSCHHPMAMEEEGC